MDENIIKRIERYYGYARSIAGENGNDLLHQVLLRLPDTLDTSIHQRLDRYIYLCLKNEFINKNSEFNKLYNPPDAQPIESVGSGYDAIQLHYILLQLEVEGFEKEVSIFKEAYFSTNEFTVSKKDGMSRHKVKMVCNFIKNEIQKRYVRDN